MFWSDFPMKEHDDRRPRLSTPEVSEMFGVSRATLYRWIKEGTIPEPARDPENGWPIWQQPELDAVAKAMKKKRKA
jgi:predicted DNA-binding transcriptional regulator AlpA